MKFAVKEISFNSFLQFDEILKTEIGAFLKIFVATKDKNSLFKSSLCQILNFSIDKDCIFIFMEKAMISLKGYIENGNNFISNKEIIKQLI